jgi:hypothetical protein
MVTYESTDLYRLRSELWALRAIVDTSKAKIDAIEERLREEDDAKRRKEHRKMIALLVGACTMWAIALFVVL